MTSPILGYQNSSNISLMNICLCKSCIFHKKFKTASKILRKISIGRNTVYEIDLRTQMIIHLTIYKNIPFMSNNMEVCFVLEVLNVPIAHSSMFT